MKLGSFRRIYKTDFKEEYQPLIEQLGNSINPGFDQLYNALNKGITFEDNIASTIVDFTVTVDVNGNPTQATSIKIDSSMSKINGLIALQAYGSKNPDVYPISGIFITFVKNEKQLTIKNITGLRAGLSYTIKVLAI